VELADTSAWTNRLKEPSVARDFTERVERGVIATCEMVDMELLWSAVDARAFRDIREARAALPTYRVGSDAWARATDVFEQLAARGPLHHRQVALPDLLIAAAAEIAGVPVCHYDRDFELIAEVTGQPVRAIAPLGSLA
jgi:predicted nucleic acid-binding protein